jgi:hypothetical protein
VLNEEVLSATSSQAVRRAAAGDAAGSPAPRYSDAAGVENHPQITDFVPRRYRMIVLLLLAGLTTAMILGGLHYFLPTIAASLGGGVEPLDLAIAGSMADWVTAVVLLLATATCLLIYSIRRHRIDDYRGRYRVWFAASVACLVLSANSVAGLHNLLAQTLGHCTGWTALRSGAAWWLILAGPPLAWITVRAFFDLKECRLAASLIAGAFACYAIAAASYFGFIPAAEPRMETLLEGVSVLLGHWLVLAAATTYARYVVLDAQGLIARQAGSAKRRTEKPTAKSETQQASKTPATVLSVAGYSRAKTLQIQPAKTPADSKSWIDGSRPERESYDDADDDDSSGPSRLSKSERKRLRKLKAQNRAA